MGPARRETGASSLSVSHTLSLLAEEGDPHARAHKARPRCGGRDDVAGLARRPRRHAAGAEYCILY